VKNILSPQQIHIIIWMLLTPYTLVHSFIIKNKSGKPITEVEKIFEIPFTVTRPEGMARIQKQIVKEQITPGGSLVIDNNQLAIKNYHGALVAIPLTRLQMRLPGTPSITLDMTSYTPEQLALKDMMVEVLPNFSAHVNHKGKKIVRAPEEEHKEEHKELDPLGDAQKQNVFLKNQLLMEQEANKDLRLYLSDCEKENRTLKRRVGELEKDLHKQQEPTTRRYSDQQFQY
jgi:hypothetical protein